MKSKGFERKLRNRLIKAVHPRLNQRFPGYDIQVYEMVESMSKQNNHRMDEGTLQAVQLRIPG